MKNALFELITTVATLVVSMFVVCTAVFAPIAWYEGHAKAAYLKKAQGIDIPWYQASWIDVDAISIDTKLAPP